MYTQVPKAIIVILVARKWSDGDNCSSGVKIAGINAQLLVATRKSAAGLYMITIFIHSRIHSFK